MRLSHQATGAHSRAAENLAGTERRERRKPIDRAREKISAAENQGDAILRALETDESERGENESQQRGDDLQISLQNRIGLEGERAEPVCDENVNEKPNTCHKDNLWWDYDRPCQFPRPYGWPSTGERCYSIRLRGEGGRCE